LLDKGAYIESRAEMLLDVLKPTLLLIAARCGNAGVVRVLKSRGADVNAKAGDGRTALHIAQTYANTSVVDVLSARNTQSRQ
jgi:ankyrin repeat protein